ncbi:hypothetical protein D3C73_1540860 [compost metagenome]
MLVHNDHRALHLLIVFTFLEVIIIRELFLYGILSFRNECRIDLVSATIEFILCYSRLLTGFIDCIINKGR